MKRNHLKVKLVLRVDDELWESFKSKITKDKTLHDAVVELIKNFVENSENGRKMNG
jgi:fatty acid-binding protein DegV